MKVAFQGERGAYSEAALLEFFGAAAEPAACADSEGTFDAVESGRAEAGFVPVENSIAGSVGVNVDLFWDRPVFAFGEAYHPIRHCLLAPPGATLDGVRTVRSHPVALAQCRPFLAARGLRAVPDYDTAGAAREVARRGAPEEAAVASRLCARVYGLTVLAEDIQSEKNNYTRFLAFRGERGAGPGAGDGKTSLAFSLADRPGALLTALSAFARRGLNLSKLESRPIASNPFEYLFFADALGGARDPSMAEALAELSAAATRVKVFGSYPAAVRPGA